ncbi:hypothetical protein GGS20DRAFT_599124 [Poronia punctata]|nr:hypothetical protein GGS20DRAFT_599124 [Poronia punctata]
MSAPPSRNDRSMVNVPGQQQTRKKPPAPTRAAPVTPARSRDRPSLSNSTRKISASFSTDGPLSGHPTIAHSDVMASTSIAHPGPLTSHPVNLDSIFSSSLYSSVQGPDPRKTLKSSRTDSNLPMRPAHQKSASSSVSAGQSYNQVTTQNTRKGENIPPRGSNSNINKLNMNKSNCPTPGPPSNSSPKKSSKSRLGLPMSRTFNVFSNITASLSRTSLIAGSDSRRASVSSRSTAPTAAGPYTDADLAASSSSQALSAAVPERPDPRYIYTAQSSAYWTGRFMALQDQFQSEALKNENLDILVHAQTGSSFATQPSLGSSATMSCIEPATQGNRRMMRAVTDSSPRKPQGQWPLRQETGAGVPVRAPVTTTTTATSTHPSYEVARALHVDEDNRCRRIFARLDSLCMTAEARKSLQKWQQSYARRMGKNNLLPRGGTMQGKTKELTWVGRLFIGSGANNRHAKKGGS